MSASLALSFDTSLNWTITTTVCIKIAFITPFYNSYIDFATTSKLIFNRSTKITPGIQITVTVTVNIITAFIIITEGNKRGTINI